ncbi:2-hydroxycarboxylate transporter family protein [Vibrio metschnikovii]|uniref:2-hydroxycarboxylate transporter family protein n=2 Tax=Bacteria TaxID=2 RepID=A0AAU6SJR8_UNCXX|nr:2-hydroxycarboxylate transporter family protein [Vibrio metschnikovii]EKO3607516.1 2-hydroxycarboxylate transporter family protein [Vibrio metschnikovii]EKO3609455.1 2-hydroxycarboxylate transporter family protein [Vibrio metschnikovii]EKO3618128.1 2-hydroxycarboxylate transporter family protein [Vibrio metschnikovii]EKO3638814.1 2-hydroxycarboxylate transporter family protein [Vibrio metschnikovii]
MLANNVNSQKDKRMINIIFALSAAVILFSTLSNNLPTGIIGAIGVMVVVGYILNLIGDKTPIINQFFGGGAIVVIFGSSYLFHSGIMPHETTETVTTFVKGGGFLSFFIASLVTGSILGMDTQVLKKAALKYIPVILGGVACAFLFAGLVGSLLGEGFFSSVMLIALPIMGGGMGAGAVPLVEIMSGNTGMSAEMLLSKMVPALAIGNAMAIVIAGLLDKLGKVYPSLTGNGQLIRGNAEQPAASENESPISINVLGIGALLAITMYFVGTMLSDVISMHPYALMILFVALVKVMGLIPRELEKAAHGWYKFVVDNLTPALLVGIGVAYTDLNQILASLTMVYFLMVLATVLGAVVGAALIGRLIGFHPIEAAITAGLCMANMGGTGDVAVLAASKRMELMPFAQISSRIGGALMLIMATFIIELLK